MPVANKKNCYRDSSHLLYVPAFTAMKDSTIINLITTPFQSHKIQSDNSNSLRSSREEVSRTKNYKIDDLHKITNTLC